MAETATDVHLVRDVLDKQLLDREHRKMGRADGVVLHIPLEGQPRVVRIETGGTTLWRRLHPGWERLAKAIRNRIGPPNDDPYPIPWEKVLSLGKNITIDLDSRRSRALAWERWLAEHVIGKIPGCASGEEDEPA